ncbi:hypothetical protein F2Q68_00028039 [Brassica cretica]|uniref:Glabrous enhancer-binding protein-like DBD domain-containing protein n=1 Tax=Brassica cretica TaxID=69181 RepID=A0A8S9IAC4_BRACR|nr:hypothetical protein F2Q68_00028039 [Brassica cretica]
MALGKRTRDYDSNDKPISSSPLRRMQEDDASGMESMLRRRKQPKTTPVSSSSNNKMNWTKDDELIILGSIVDYEKETKLSHRSDWDAFYGYVKDFIEADFSKKQLTDKIRNLNKRFLGNKARCDDEEGPSFTDTEDDIIFKLSVIIWNSTNETGCASDENVDQAKECAIDLGFLFLFLDKDVPCVESEPVDENMDQAKVDAPSVEHEQVSENMDQAKDVPCVEHEPVDENMDPANVDLPCVEDERVDENVDQAKDALEETTFFQSIGKYQQKVLLQNLKNLRGPRRKELADELKELLDEEMKVRAKKLSLTAKLASAWEESLLIQK